MMDSNYNRGYYVMVTYLWALFIAACFNYMTGLTIYSSKSATGVIQFESVRDLTVNKDLKADQANISFKLGFDLTSEFDWNCKQLYVYVVAEYSTERKPRNEVTVMDWIVQDVSEAKIDPIRSFVNEFPIRDQFKETLLGTEVTLKVYYERLPIFGFSTKKFLAQSAAPPFKLPLDYKRLSSTRT